MKTSDKTSRTQLLAPLTVAISGMLVACVSPQTNPASTVTISPTPQDTNPYATPQTQTYNQYGQDYNQSQGYQNDQQYGQVAQDQSIYNQNIYNQNPQDTYAGVLPQEVLDELEDLLQATDMSMVEGDAWTVSRYGDLWDRVRRGYRMNFVQNPRIEAQKSWFYGRQDYLNRLTARTSRYLHHTVTEAERRGIPTELALLPIIESSYDPSATSNAAAAGLWQFIPSTGRIYGLNQSTNYDGRRDVIESTRAAYDFLTSLYNQFGSWELALAAYNAGPGRIQRAIDANRASGLPTDYWSLRLPGETMNYVPRFLAVAQIVASPNNYGVHLPAIANHSHFRAVPVNYGVSLYEVANITGVPVDELRLLNPALIRFNVDSAGPGRVLIPNAVPTSADVQLRALQGVGYGATSYVANTYVSPKTGVQNANSAQELASANALPTTSASITANNSIIQEPPLSQEERDFIAEQIRRNTIENIQPISSDGNIDLKAVQTAQSVLEARGEVKSLSFNAPVVQSAPINNSNTVSYTANTPVNTPVSTAPATPIATTSASKAPARQSAPVERYKVVAGDTLTGIAHRHGLTVSQLASYNGIPADTMVKTGERLWLVPGRVSTVAKTNRTKTPTNTTTTHVVQAGESLTSVARKYNTTVADLAAMNGLSVTDGILIDQRLTVPTSAGVKSTTPAKPTTTPNKVASQVKQQPVSYTIQSGDSLTSVANKYGITVTDLANANGMSPNAGLISGKTLTIPPKGVKVAPPTTTTAPTTSSTTVVKNTKKLDSYTVQAGDSLTSLAKKHGITVAELASANGLPNTAGLKSGQVIKIPKLTRDYTVQAGDSLTSLAKKHGITVAELAKLNNLGVNDGLFIGQVISVPNK